MARDSDNAQALVDSFVYVAPKGTALPIIPTATPAAGLDPAFKDTGWLTDTGLGEVFATNTNVRRAINGTVIKTIRTTADTSFTFECYERNAITIGLIRPGSAPLTAGDTAEVQTITITGAPTGGTFKSTVQGIGSITPVYNITTAALATALSALVGFAVTVTGTPGSSYVVTFAPQEGNIAQMTVDGSGLTGGTTPTASVATGTPGTSGVTTTPVKAYLGSDERSFVLKEDFGVWQRVVAVPRGEAFVTANVQDKPGDLAVVQFRIDCYPDSSGVKYIDITNNPAEAVS